MLATPVGLVPGALLALVGGTLDERLVGGDDGAEDIEEDKLVGGGGGEDEDRLVGGGGGADVVGPGRHWK